MKLTDFALIFIGVTLPIIITVYINVSFTIKAEEQEMYYKKIINVALKDAADQMKEVENSDSEIDYGYSGTANNKVSVNSQIAVDTFFNSLYNNFGIKGNQAAESYLQYFIPAIAIIDYNGVQVSSIEEFQFFPYDEGSPEADYSENVISHALKPKRYYTYTYYIYMDLVEDRLKYTDDYSIAKGTLHSTHIIEFTMDDYITHRGFKANGSKDDIPVTSFYISDSKNNLVLVKKALSIEEFNNYEKTVLQELVSHLQAKRKEVIISTIQKEMQYATNNNNYYASQVGIKYNFVFPTLEEAELESQIKNVGMMALVQGISIGNKYLNVRAYSTAKLTEITRYYLSIPKENKSKYNMNLYHKDTACPEYICSSTDNITPKFLPTKQQAASVKATSRYNDGRYIALEGFYPCPICNP